MTAKDYSNVMKRVRDQGEARGLASDLSATVRQLDLLERRTKVTQDYAPRLAALIVELDGIGQHLDSARDLAARGDARSKFLLAEHAALSAEVSKKLKFYLLETGDASVSQFGTLGWAKRILAAHKR
ncbi:MAG: hypothetical protein A2148_08470 [Chloroflexi bacterium RBG_16_68_14]|nr:MAG: hypothetical protein A2148_08470 [Chloroflexi bacterium RBG_16_68_14]